MKMEGVRLKHMIMNLVRKMAHKEDRGRGANQLRIMISLYVKLLCYFTAPLFLVILPFMLYKTYMTTLLILSILLVGVLFTLIVGTLHVREVKKITESISHESLSARQKRSLIADLTYKEAIDWCLRFIEETKGIKLVSQNPRGLIIARKKLSFKSFGNKIRLEVTRIDDRSTEIIIESEPILPTTVVDFGESLQIIDIMYNKLRRL